MANKAISMAKVRRIVQLKSEGLSKLKISQTLGIMTFSQKTGQ